jgi:hypothetical protein
MVFEGNGMLEDQYKDSFIKGKYWKWNSHGL